MISKDEKLYCANNLVVMVISNLKDDQMRDRTENEIIAFFSSSAVYRQLYDFKTGLWKEGPDYLISLLEKETGSAFKIFNDFH